MLSASLSDIAEDVVEDESVVDEDVDTTKYVSSLLNGRPYGLLISKVDDARKILSASRFGFGSSSVDSARQLRLSLHCLCGDQCFASSTLFDQFQFSLAKITSSNFRW